MRPLHPTPVLFGRAPVEWALSAPPPRPRLLISACPNPILPPYLSEVLLQMVSSGATRTAASPDTSPAIARVARVSFGHSSPVSARLQTRHTGAGRAPRPAARAPPSALCCGCSRLIPPRAPVLTSTRRRCVQCRVPMSNFGAALLLSYGLCDCDGFCVSLLYVFVYMCMRMCAPLPLGFRSLLVWWYLALRAAARFHPSTPYNYKTVRPGHRTRAKQD